MTRSCCPSGAGCRSHRLRDRAQTWLDNTGFHHRWIANGPLWWLCPSCRADRSQGLVTGAVHAAVDTEGVLRCLEAGHDQAPCFWSVNVDLDPVELYERRAALVHDVRGPLVWLPGRRWITEEQE